MNNNIHLKDFFFFFYMAYPSGYFAKFFPLLLLNYPISAVFSKNRQILWLEYGIHKSRLLVYSCLALQIMGVCFPLLVVVIALCIPVHFLLPNHPHEQKYNSFYDILICSQVLWLPYKMKRTGYSHFMHDQQRWPRTDQQHWVWPARVLYGGVPGGSPFETICLGEVWCSL